jgi:hypothetical protein
MKMPTTTHVAQESTYALLVRSEKQERSGFETAVYLLLIICAAFAVWESAHQPFMLPAIGLMQGAPVAQSSSTRNHSA